MTGQLTSCYSLIVLMCAIGLTIGTCEFMVIAGAFSPTGVYSWKIGRLAYKPGMIAVALRPIAGSTGIRCLLALRLLLIAGLCVAPLAGAPFTIVLALLVVSNGAFTLRRVLGDDGSDQMNAIILVTLLLCCNPFADDFVLECGLWFLALQVCLSYTTAGIAKLASPSWRSGDAIYQVLNTCTFGHEWAAGIVEHRAWLRRLLCWSVMLIEASFFASLLLPLPAVWCFLAAGVLFHLGCAVFMGLNTFVFAFLATYPAMYFAAQRMDSYLWQ